MVNFTGFYIASLVTDSELEVVLNSVVDTAKICTTHCEIRSSDSRHHPRAQENISEMEFMILLHHFVRNLDLGSRRDDDHKEWATPFSDRCVSGAESRGTIDS